MRLSWEGDTWIVKEGWGGMEGDDILEKTVVVKFKEGY